MAKLRVKDIVHRHTKDIDLTRVAQSKEWDKLANVCVLKATLKALDLVAAAANVATCGNLADAPGIGPQSIAPQIVKADRELSMSGVASLVIRW